MTDETTGSGKGRGKPAPSAAAGSGRRPDVPESEASLLRFLVRSAQDLNSTLELNEVFRKVAERVIPFVDCHLFCVMLWNDETRLLEHSFSMRHGEHVPLEGGFPLGYGISGTAASRRESMRVSDTQGHELYVRHRHPDVDIRSELAIPLVFKDRLIGVLDLESEEPGAFTEDHEQVLCALASHVAIALENARLYEKVVRDEQRLERDLSTAREIQKGLLPDKGVQLGGLEVGAAYQPARELGGDFYDFLPYGEGRLAVAIGDVSGKGTPAALYGSLAVGILRGHVVEHPCEPAEMLSLLNRQLYRSGLQSQYVALTFGVYDTDDHSLTLANGGFTEPILMRGDQLRKIEIRGMPLGLMPGARYEQTRIDFASGDVIAFCSDGLLESVNGVGEQFGTSDLGDVLQSLALANAQQIADGILRANTAFAGEDEAHPDDRSVMVLKFG